MLTAKSVQSISMDLKDKLLEFAKELIGDGFEFRPYQLETIVQVVENARDNIKQTVLEAPTGSGKSIIGILAAYALYKLYGKTSYILASDLSLFAQYENDLKMMKSDCFGWIKGKENYICNDNGCSVSQATCALKGASPMKLAKTHLFESCKHTCEYVKDYARAASAPITLMTYQLYFIQRNYVEDSLFGGKNVNFPERDFVICDECHKLCDICQAHFAPKASIARPNWMETLDKYSNMPASEDARKYIINELLSSESNKELLDAVCKYKGFIEHYLDVNESIRKRLASKKSLSKSDKQALNAGNMARQEHCKFEDMVNFVHELEAEDYIVKSVSRSDVTINFVFDNAMLDRHFHEKSKCELLMSATIGDFNEYAKIAGLDYKKFKHISMPSTFDFSKSPIYYATTNRMSYAEKSSSFRSVVAQAASICNVHVEDRGIVQTGSYDNCETLKRLLPKDILARCIFYKGSADKSLALRKFMSLGCNPYDNHILVGPTLIEGLNFPDNLCRFQICIKVPFAHLGNEYVKLKKELIDGWYKYDALTKVCQGIGRGVRHPNDWCKTYILDGCIVSLIEDLNKFGALAGRFAKLDDNYLK